MLDDEVDVSRGDMLVAPDARPEVADQFAATPHLDRRAAAASRPLLYPADRDRSVAARTSPS